MDQDLINFTLKCRSAGCVPINIIFQNNLSWKSNILNITDDISNGDIENVNL